LDGEITRELVRDILGEGGFRTIESADGKDVISLLRRHRPVAALIDVGLPEVLGFQLCEEIKNDPDLKGTVVILVASIYDKSKHKLRPDQLYGAEDFIGRQSLPEDLLPTVKKHLSGGARAPEPSARHPAGAPREREPACPAPTEKARPGQPVASSRAGALSVASPEIEAAKRLARIIVADIALYNKKQVEEGIRNGTLRQLLQEQLTEGRRHYDSRVPEEVRRDRDYYEEAIEDLIRRKTEGKLG
jgi:CheY-like chemotaxis protein